jgi:5-methylcytosine-specific restriction endonuclease McrA
MVPYVDGRTRRYCSIKCRDAKGRVDVTCEHCGTAFSRTASTAASRRFCSRQCLFEAWGCAWCHLIVPDERRTVGDPYCSDRCAVSAHLDQQAQETGHRMAVCGPCRRILPASEFHREKANRNGLSGRCKACTKAKYEANKPDYQRRRWVTKAAPGGVLIEFTAEQRAARWSMWAGRCWVCGVADATEEDHTKPISQGGSHCLSNLRPICKSCNARKHARWPLIGPPYDRANFTHPNPRPGSDAADRTPRMPRVKWTCPHCQVTRLVRAHEARDRKYCSRECHNAALASTRTAKSCGICQREFLVAGDRWSLKKKYCSERCAQEAQRRGGRRCAPGQGQAPLW